MIPRRMGLPLLILALTAAGCRETVEAPAPVRPVLSVVVQARNGVSADFVGSIEPRHRSDLSFQALGRIVSRSVDVGDRVSKDQVLAELDPMTFEMAVRSAGADLTGAEAQLTNARGADQRMRALLEKDNVSAAQADAARRERETAEAAVARARAGVAKAIDQLGHTKLSSEFDGVVTAVSAQVGQVVSAGQTVVSVARSDVREAVIAVPTATADELRPGSRFDVRLLLDPTQSVSGPVREIDPQADSVTRTRRVRVALDDPPPTFRLGANVIVTSRTEEPPFIELPVSALFEKDGETLVWVVDDTTRAVATRKVQIAARDDANARIASGVEPGTRVVVAGARSLTPGQTVKVIEEDRR